MFGVFVVWCSLILFEIVEVFMVFESVVYEGNNDKRVQFLVGRPGEKIGDVNRLVYTSMG